MSAPALIFLLDDAPDSDAFSAGLSSVAEAIVVSFPGPSRERSDERIEAAALGWTAEHASELGATPRLLVAGVYIGGGHAARLATAARDVGWPALHRQLLLHPTFDAACPIPPRLDGAAPATIVTADETGTRYGAQLRAAGIDVEELHVRDRCLPRGAQLAKLVRSLGLGATDERSTGRWSYQT
jgi:hypothetical protein